MTAVIIFVSSSFADIFISAVVGLRFLSPISFRWCMKCTSIGSPTEYSSIGSTVCCGGSASEGLVLIDALEVVVELGEEGLGAGKSDLSDHVEGDV